MPHGEWLPIGDVHRMTAEAALRRWSGGGNIEHVQNSGNFVYRCTLGKTTHILRLTNPRHRTLEQCVAEAEFVAHVARCGVRVAEPVPSDGGRLVEDVAGLPVSVFTWAPGTRPTLASPREVFVAWGAALRAVHDAARAYKGPARWHWTEEDLIANAKTYLPTDDTAARREFDEVMDALTALPEIDFGMIHADLGPPNLHWQPNAGLTLFDFGNCCDHWFASDLAISFSTIRGQDRQRAWIEAGYGTLPAHADRIDLFIRLRVLYAYLSRLKFFGPAPSREQREILAAMRTQVHERRGWR